MEYSLIGSTLFSRNKKEHGIEELLGFNIRNDRIVVSGKQLKETKSEQTVIDIDWTKYTVAETTEEGAKPAVTLTQEQVEMIKKVQANEEAASVAYVDSLVAVLAASTECAECRVIFAKLGDIFKYDNSIVAKLLSSTSLRMLAMKLSKCLNTLQCKDEQCTCECKTNETVRKLIIRMAAFVSGLFRVCDEDVLCEETATAHQALCAQILEMEFQFFSELNREHLDENECVFMMDVLTLYLRNKANRVESLRKGLLKL